MRTRRSWLVTIALAATMVACTGGRSQIEFDGLEDVEDADSGAPTILDGGSDQSVADADAEPTPEASVDGAGGAGGSGGAGGADGGQGGTGGGGGGGGIIGNAIQCIQCVQQDCPQVAQCLIQDATCRQGILCVFQKCAGLGGGGSGGGGFDPGCALQCFNGNLSAAFEAFQGVQCFFQSCGTTCGGLLPGAGGGGFPGLPGGGGVPAPETPAPETPAP